MAREITIPEFGLHLVAGLMGSGKSYVATKTVLEVVQHQRRPVYTNLPLRWRVCRKYLRDRGGQKLANLLHELTEAHWRRFLTRQRERSEFMRALKVTREDERRVELTPEQHWLLTAHVGPVQPERAVWSGVKLSSAQRQRLWLAHAGPDITEGPDANWIPAFAFIVIDEVQHWHPMARQGTETPDLLAYVSMLRHHLHLVWVITQEMGRVDITFRKLAHFFWSVENLGERRLAWGIKFKHLGVRPQGYARYTPGAWEVKGRGEEGRPVEQYIVWPRWPFQATLSRLRVLFGRRPLVGGLWVYRMYSSFTNIGSERELRHALQRARVAAGLDERGNSDEPEEEPVAKKEPKRRRWIRRLVKLSGLVVVGGVAYAAGAGGRPDAPEVVAVEPVAAAPVEPADVEPVWPRWTVVTRAGARIDGEAVGVGSRLANGAEVLYFDADARALVLGLDGYAWLWRYRSDPVRVGTYEDVRDAVTRWDAGWRRVGGGSADAGAGGGRDVGLGAAGSLGELRGESAR